MRLRPCERLHACHAGGFRFPHQCIIADLTSPSVVVPFSMSSAWKDFNFDHASKLERMARIDIGAQLAPRDVFVYVQTDKMAPSRTGAAAVRTQVVGSRQGREWARWPALIVPGHVTEEQSRALQALVTSGKLRYSDIAKVMPRTRRTFA